MISYRHVAGASFLLALSLSALSQTAGGDAVAWTSTATPVTSANGERLFRLQLDGRIAAGYIVYGSDFKAELGPNPTRVRFATESGITPQGPLESIGSHTKTDPVFKADFTYFRDEARLSQVIAVGPGTDRIVGTIKGQTCYEADGTCQLFDASFSVAIP